jgi:single-strand DNA-binding protein
MASFNRVILMGNLTRDPQVRYIPSGSAVAEIGLAVNRTWFDKQTNSRKEEVTFVDVTLWGRDAEVAGEYLTKGRSVLVEGRLSLDSWDDKATGQKRSKLKVVGERLVMVGGRGDGGGGPGGGAQGGSSAGRRSAPAESSPSPEYGGGDFAPDYGGGSFGGGSAGPGGGGGDEDVPF